MSNNNYNNNNNNLMDIYRPSSCFHCRAAHIGCDKKRPCGRCVRLGKDCVEAEKSMHRRSLVSRMQQQQQQQQHHHYPFQQSFIEYSTATMPSRLLSFDEHVPTATAFLVPSASSSATSQIGNKHINSNNSNSNLYISSIAGSIAAEQQSTLASSGPCMTCKNVHVACDRQRPCSRCVRLNVANTCQDPPSKRTTFNTTHDFNDDFTSHSTVTRSTTTAASISNPTTTNNISTATQQQPHTIMGWYDNIAPAVDPRILYLIGPKGWTSRASEEFLLDAKEDSDFPFFSFQRRQTDFIKKQLWKSTAEYPTPTGSPPANDISSCLKEQLILKDQSVQTDPFSPDEIMMNATFVPL